MAKTLNLSSSGLKNIIKEEKQFTFTFGSHEVHMNTLYAEFISPIVSNIHLSDPTINSFQFDFSTDFPQYKEIINEETISIFKNLSSGSSISINEEQCIKMQLISIIIGNEELFQKLDELFPIEFNISTIDHYMQNLQMLIYFSTKSNRSQFAISSLIDSISSNFYLIDEKVLRNLTEEALYSILTNKNLKIDSEDSLFEFINKFYWITIDVIQ